MTTRFIGKNVRKMVVRPIKNSVKNKKQTVAVIHVESKIVESEDVVSDVVPKKENKKQKKNKEMVNENKLTKMESIVNSDAPKAKVKFEKADEGLYERTENSTILLTEDNKMLLND